MEALDTNALVKRMESVEATVARLATSLDGMVDTIVTRVVDTMDERSHAPIVMTKAQLEGAISAVMSAARSGEASKTPPAVVSKPTHMQSVRRQPTPVAAKPTRAIQVSPTTIDQRMEREPISPPSLTLSMFDMEMQPYRASEYQMPTVVPQRPPPPPRTQVVQHNERPRTAQPPPQMTQPLPQTSDNGRLYLWGNAWHHLPEEYEFPKESLEVMWRQWCVGDTEKGYKPLRLIQASDIASANNRKRFSDLKFLMKHIEQNLRDCGVWKETPNVIEADQMLRAVRDQLPIAGTTGKGQKRELEGIKWLTAVTLLRSATSANKKARNE